MTTKVPSCGTCGTLQACPSCKLREAYAVKRAKKTAQLNKLRDQIVSHCALNADTLTRDDVNALITAITSVRDNWYPLPIETTTDRTG